MKDACQNCNQDDYVTLYHAPAFDVANAVTKRYFDIARCQYCNLVTTVNARPDDIAAAYANEYYGSASRKFSSSIENILEMLAKHRALKIVTQWQEQRGTSKSPTVLDIGCGRGIMLRAFQTLGADVTGIERRGFPLDHTIRDLVHIGTLSDPELAGQRFDIVILWHVLEHIPGSETLLEEITSHMSDNGLLVIAVPNFDSWQRRLFGAFWFHLDLPRHVIHFEPVRLTSCLENFKLRIENISYFEPVQAVYGFLQSVFNTLMPSRLNECYTLLKHGDPNPHKKWLLAFWMPLGALLLPFACIESLLAAIFHKGATFVVAARLEK
ncbi:MAG: class I SAM-dependent methyltransferase [Pseudomonadales bacterium]